MHTRHIVAILAIWTGVVGCARWEVPDKKSRPIFPKSRIALDAVGLELGLAQLDVNQGALFETFWESLDQQAFPLDLRQRLDQNGIRVAIMPSHAPAMLHQLVDPKPIVVDELTELEKQLHSKGLLREKQRMVAHERISNREGEAHSISVSGYHPQISWVVRDGDKETPGFGSLVRGVITVTTFPQGDGSVRLILGPEVHYGQTRPQIAERSFLKEARQSVRKIDELNFEAILRPGESIVIAPTADNVELGKVFFGSTDTESGDQNPAGTDPSHRVLLIRVVQTQMDDLFSDPKLAEKLTTTHRY